MEVKDYPANNSTVNNSTRLVATSVDKELAKEEVSEKKVEKVITTSAKKKKKGFFVKMAESFIPEDTKDIKSYVFTDVVVPAIKGVISDTIEKLLYGSDSRRRSSGDRFAASRVSYRSYYDSDKRERGSESRGALTYSYDEVVIPDRGDAQLVLDRMDELMAKYEVVSVADFYDLVGIQGNYTDNNYGWDDIRSARVERVRDGFVIKLPRATPINHK